MNQEALFHTMADQTGRECDKRITAARGEAERIVAEAEDEAARKREETLKATHAEVDELAKRSRQRADAEAAKAKLTMRHRVAEEVLATVGDEIRKLVDSDEFPKVLNALLPEVMAAKEGSVVVLAPEAHADHCRQWLAENGHDDVKVEGSGEFWDGVAIQDAKRTWRVSNTLTGRFAILEDELRKECIARLFGDES